MGLGWDMCVRLEISFPIKSCSLGESNGVPFVWEVHGAFPSLPKTRKLVIVGETVEMFANVMYCMFVIC